MRAIDTLYDALFIQPADRFICEVIRRDVPEDRRATECCADTCDRSAEESTCDEHGGKNTSEKMSRHDK